MTNDGEQRDGVDIEKFLDGFDGLDLAELAERLNEARIEDHSV